MKYCRDCRHYQDPQWTYAAAGMAGLTYDLADQLVKPKCTRRPPLLTEDPVYGPKCTYQHVPCVDERNDQDPNACGMEARYYEERPVPEYLTRWDVPEPAPSRWQRIKNSPYTVPASAVLFALLVWATTHLCVSCGAGQ